MPCRSCCKITRVTATTGTRTTTWIITRRRMARKLRLHDRLPQEFGIVVVGLSARAVDARQGQERGRIQIDADRIAALRQDGDSVDVVNVFLVTFGKGGGGHGCADFFSDGRCMGACVLWFYLLYV